MISLSRSVPYTLPASQYIPFGTEVSGATESEYFPQSQRNDLVVSCS